MHSLGMPGRGLPSLDRFELIEEIGRGGMGVVYKARQPVLNRIVAVKVILAGSGADARERDRLRFEAEAVARLHHPNIVQVHEFVEQDDLPYIVLEYVDGCNLAELFKRSERRVAWSVGLIETLARAIGHAHQRGIVHRDLTPANVLIAADGTPKISDFGLAKSIVQETSVSSSGSFLGTPRYMAPEQVAGRSCEVGPPADIYALGAILYELLTGVVPFRGKTPLETMRKVMEGMPEPPSRVRPDVPVELETICLKCLEREPARRYLSAAELAEDLRRFQAGEPIRARPISGGRRLLKWVRRRPAEASLMALLALGTVAVLVAGVLWNTWLRRHGVMLEATLERERGYAAAARVARGRAEENERIARRHWYGSQLKLAQQAGELGQFGLTQELLANERLVPGGAGLQSFEWFYLHRLCTRDYSLLWGHTEAVSTLALSRDGRTLVSRDFEGGVLLHDLATGQAWGTDGALKLIHSQAAGGLDQQARLQGLGTRSAVTLREVMSGRDLALTPGSNRDVSLLGFDHAGSTLFAWDSQPPKLQDKLSLPAISGEPRLGAAFRDLRPSAVAYSPDGHWFAVGDADGHLLLCDAEMGREPIVLEGTVGPVHALGFSGDGKRLAASVGDNGTAIWAVESGRLLEVFSDHAETVNEVRLSPDGLSLAAIEGHHIPVLRRVAAGRKRVVLSQDSGWLHGLEFSPDGRRLAIAGNGVSPRLYDVDTGVEQVRFPGEIGMTRSLAFTRDGRTLILGGEDSRIRLWHLQPPVAAAGSLPGHEAETWALAFSPDGKTLASGSDEPSIALWDVESRQRHSTLKGHPATVSALAFAPNGRLLAAADLANNVKIWDADQGRELATLAGHVERVRAVAFAPDGKTLASTGSDRTVRLWDVPGRTCRAVLRGHIDTIRALAFSPDGRILASAGNDRKVILHDPDGGPPRRMWSTSGEATSLSFSPDGQRLAVGGENHCVTIWDVASGRLLVTLPGIAHRVLTLTYSPDGKSLASAGEDRAIHLWDPLTGQERLTLRGHAAKINSVAFSPDGQYLASGSHDGAIRLWYAPRDELVSTSPRAQEPGQTVGQK